MSGQLLAMIEAEARSPEGRARLLRDLSETVRMLHGRCGCRDGVMVNAVEALAAALITAGDHAEFIAQRITAWPPP